MNRLYICNKSMSKIIISRICKSARCITIPLIRTYSNGTTSKQKFDLKRIPDMNWLDIHKPNHPNIEWAYRDTSERSSNKEKLGAEILMTIMWYWILWHVYYDYEHLVGHYEYPDPAKWTNEELGIPSDNN